MDEQMKRKLDERRKQIYTAVRNARPDLYGRAVEIGHLAMEQFGGEDPLKRAVAVEGAVMSLMVQLLELEV